MSRDKTEIPTRAIKVRGLKKSFGEHRALRGIDIEIAEGECLAVFGPNGAGKTTFLKILAILLKPSAGSVFLEGAGIRKEPVKIRRKISLVSHQTFLYNDLTIYENLKFYGRMYDIEDLEKRIDEVITWAELGSRRDDRVGTLSRGLQQRTSLARAILHHPSFLFLDEPEVGLDPRTGDMIRDIIGNSDSGIRTAVMATHNLERGLELGDRIIILDRGKIIYQAAKEELAGADLREIYDQCIEANQ
jgi:ABC-type multidrug transport system ATPase subunit